MAIGLDRTALRPLRTLFNVGTIRELTDGQLLERFTTRDGEAAELAFAALVERHGPMVLRVCRAVLRDAHDAHDAFQATFLVLVRRAGSLWVRDSLGPWLHQVALRTAACCRSANARRRRHERRAAEQWAARTGDESARSDGPEAALHEELGRLPERYRVAVVLCDLEGRSLDQAARDLGCPVGTIKSRLARGRDRLRGRLTRRGLAPTAALLITALSKRSASAMPAALAESTIRALSRPAAGHAATEAVSAAVASLTQGVLETMFMNRLKRMMAVVVSVGLAAVGAGVLAQQESGRPPGPARDDRAAASPSTQKDRARTYTYPVADLVWPAGRPSDGGPVTPSSMEPVIELLTASVAPGTWKERDDKGRHVDGAGDDGARRVGSITPFFLNTSLIVRHTPEVHDQVVERLRQLRRLVHAPDSPEAEERKAPSSDRAVTPAEHGPDTEIERRLSDVERKLDQVLKTLEALGRGGGR